MRTAFLIFTLLFTMPLIAQNQPYEYAIGTGNGMVAAFRACDSAGTLFEKIENRENTDRTVYQ